LSIEAVQYEGNYMSFLKQIMVPAFFMAAIALMMFIFPNQLSFLVVY